MLRATKDLMLPTTITGSLPRPSWYTQNLGMRSFLDAMVNNQFREQYVDTVGIYLHEQEMAGLDIVTDGDAHFDSDVGGQSWTNYPPRHMGGFDKHPQPTPAGKGGLMFPPGHILHDYLEARVMPGINGPVTRGELQYSAMWKVAQRMTKKPVKFGTIGPELVAFAVQDKHYKSIKDRILAISDALNEELHTLADAGCQVIQFEEPQIHMLAIRKVVDEVINPDFSVEVFNRTVKGLRGKTEVWCHTCWGNPSQQRMFKEVQSYKNALEMLNKVDADVITFEFGQRRRHGPGSLRQGHLLGQEDRHRRHRPSLAAGREAGGDRRSHPPRAQIHSGRAAGDLVRLRHGPRGHEPAPRLLQDRGAGARHQHGAQGAWAAASRMPGRRRTLFAGGFKRLTRRAALPKAERVRGNYAPRIRASSINLCGLWHSGGGRKARW